MSAALLKRLPMKHQIVRRLALALPQTEEKSHFGKADFRVRNVIFASLPDDDHAVVKFHRDQQEMLVSSVPAIFEPVQGSWGRQGWTTIILANADELTLKSALLTAWRNVAPVALVKSFDVSSLGDGGRS